MELDLKILNSLAFDLWFDTYYLPEITPHNMIFIEGFKLTAIRRMIIATRDNKNIVYLPDCGYKEFIVPRSIIDMVNDYDIAQLQKEWKELEKSTKETFITKGNGIFRDRTVPFCREIVSFHDTIVPPRQKTVTFHESVILLRREIVTFHDNVLPLKEENFSNEKINTKDSEFFQIEHAPDIYWLKDRQYRHLAFMKNEKTYVCLGRITYTPPEEGQEGGRSDWHHFVALKDEDKNYLDNFGFEYLNL